jgi:CheY-like chemotaxis protein
MVGARALVVDDDPDIRRLVGVVLEIEGGWSCDEAGDALHALELWHTHHHDVVVVDQRMPRVSGLELAAQLLEEDPNQIVIVFSAFLDNHTVDRALQLGVTAVLSKEEIRRLPGLIGEALTG